MFRAWISLIFHLLNGDVQSLWTRIPAKIPLNVIYIDLHRSDVRLISDPCTVTLCHTVCFPSSCTITLDHDLAKIAKVVTWIEYHSSAPWLLLLCTHILILFNYIHPMHIHALSQLNSQMYVTTLNFCPKKSCLGKPAIPPKAAFKERSCMALLCDLRWPPRNCW